MFDSLFAGIFDSPSVSVIPVSQFLLCLGCALAAGLILAVCYMYRSHFTRSFVVTLAVLPAVVCVVIMMVNGNVGAGVAVAGAFSLVRFRSVPGTAREITMLFLAMGAGLIAGMGYLGYSLLFTVVMALFSLLYTHLDLGFAGANARYRSLTVTIPEDLDYTHVFDDIFRCYTQRCELVRVKTTNLGSLFRLTYDVVLQKDANEKEMMDAIRCRNGNLEIIISRQQTTPVEL